MLTLNLIKEETDRVVRGLEKKHFKGAKEAINKVLETDKKRRQTQQTLDIDMELDFQQVNKRLLNELKRLAPHGPGNSKPLFITRNVFDYGTSKVVGRHQEHIKLELVDSKSAVVMNGIAFGQSAAARYIKSKRSFDIVYTIEENTYKRGEVQLQIEDIRPSEEGVEEDLQSRTLHL